MLLVILWLAERALRSPWGRMMRAIRDNRDAAEAMGKDVTRRHLQVFVLGSAVVGVAGAMLVTLDGQFTPGSYNPLRYTFLIWVMVIVGGSGNNWGAVLGGFLIWYVWVMAEPAGTWIMGDADRRHGPRAASGASHLLAAAPHLRLFLMGLILLLVLRFAPQGLIPERSARRQGTEAYPRPCAWVHRLPAPLAIVAGQARAAIARPAARESEHVPLPDGAATPEPGLGTGLSIAASASPLAVFAARLPPRALAADFRRRVRRHPWAAEGIRPRSFTLVATLAGALRRPARLGPRVLDALASTRTTLPASSAHRRGRAGASRLGAYTLRDAASAGDSHAHRDHPLPLALTLLRIGFLSVFRAGALRRQARRIACARHRRRKSFR